MHRTSLTHATAVIATALAITFGAPPIDAESLDIVRATFVEQDAKTAQISTEELAADPSRRHGHPSGYSHSSGIAAGHIPGAHFLGDGAATQLAALTQLVGGDKSKALVLYCNGPYCSGEQALRRAAACGRLCRRAALPTRHAGMARPLGGPTEISIEGLRQVYGRDQTAIFIDARSPDGFAAGSVPGAKNLPVKSFAAGKIKQPPLPVDPSIRASCSSVVTQSKHANWPRR